MTSDFKTVLAVLAAALALGALTAAPALASGEPFVETKPATSIGKTSATLHAVVNPEGSATEYWFEYGATEKYGKTTPAASAGSGTSNVEVSATVTGLAASGRYHFRVLALNGIGFGIGSDAVFTTTGLPEFSGEFPNKFTATTTASVLETVKPNTVECPASSGSGAITGEKSLNVSSGKLILGESEGGLIYRKGAALLLITAKGGGNFPEFRCSAFRFPGIKVTARGELLCEIGPVNVETTNFTLKCRQTRGQQSPGEYENGVGGEKVKPLFETRGIETIELWPWEQSGIETTTEITTENKIEIMA